MNSITSTRSSRRGREKDTRDHRASSVASPSGGRRPKDILKSSENKSPSRKASTPSLICSQQNLVPDQSPVLRSSVTISTVAASPTPSSAHLVPNNGGVYHLPYQPHTPASLRPYLEGDAEDDLMDSAQPSSHAQPSTCGRELDLREALTSRNQESLSDQAGSEQDRSSVPNIHNRHPRNSVELNKEGLTRDTAHDLTSHVSQHEVTELCDHFSMYPDSQSQFHAAYGPQSSQMFRAFTPPALPLGTAQSPNPSMFIPPLPTNNQALDTKCYGYTGSPAYPPIRHVIASQEMYRGPAPHAAYYVDFQPPNHPHMPFHTLANPGDLPTFEGRPSLEDSCQPPLGSKSDNISLLSRVQASLPDLHLLLDNYWELCRQPIGEYTKNCQMAETEALRQRDDYINSLLEELEKRARIHAAECTELRSEICKLEVMYREMQGEVAIHRRARRTLEGTVERLKGEKAAVDERVREGIAIGARGFETWKNRVTMEFEAKEKAMRSELDLKANESFLLRFKGSNIVETQSEDEISKVKSVPKRRQGSSTQARKENELQTSSKAQPTSSQQASNNASQSKELLGQDWSASVEKWEHRLKMEPQWHVRGKGTKRMSFNL